MNHFMGSLLPHVKELKNRFLKTIIFLVVSFLICFFYANSLFKILACPLEEVLSRHQYPKEWLYTNLSGVLSTHIEIAFFGSLSLTLPYVLLQVWQFLLPGLLESEKTFCRLLFLLCPFLFWMGAFSCYYYVMPKTWEFFINFGESSNLPLRFFPMMDQYLSISLKFIFSFGFCFQLPLFMLFLSHLELVTAETFSRLRRFVIVGIFVLAALMTPPDVLSQILLALPLWGLYELSIVLIRLKEKKTDHA